MRALAASLLALAVALAAMLLDAGRRRDARPAGAHRALVAATGLPDLALSSSSRWLRHPSEAEAGAALADVPGGPDTDPAGGLIGPPVPILRVGGVTHATRTR